jgi:hypothetical protein
MGSEHPATLNSIDNLAATHLSVNPDLALPMPEEALNVRRRTSGNQHAGTLRSTHGLVGTRAVMGELLEVSMLPREYTKL